MNATPSGSKTPELSEGVRRRKWFLADKKSTKRNVKKGKRTHGETVIKHNKDMNRFLLTDALALAAVFLDGWLSKHFRSQESRPGWSLSMCHTALNNYSVLYETVSRGSDGSLRK